MLALAWHTAAADLILHNGRIWTADPARGWADALAITGSRITAVGGEREVAAWRRPATRLIDLKGRLAVPGFNDAHIHFLSGSLGLFEVDLTGACTLDQMQQRVRDYAGKNPGDGWITGSGWEYFCFPGHRLPHKQDLDAILADRPVFLRAYDGHTGWANSKALRIAEITRATRFEGFGEIVRDPSSGEPTGCLKEGAQRLVSRHIPQPDRARKLAALEKGMKLAASLGITSIQNASGDPDTLSLYDQLLREKKLTLRVSMAFSAGRPLTEARLGELRKLQALHNGPLLRAGAVKFMVDGVIESHTAAMLAPYSDDSSTAGSPAWPAAELNDAVARSDAAGLQVYIHAIGDRGVRMALDAFEHARRTNGPRDARFRIEHIETIAAGDLPRFASLGVMASMEPIHADPATVELWSRAVGPARLPLSFPWGSLERAGARLVFSSDWPASISVDPIRGIHNAVNRRTVDGRPPGGWLPAQRVSLETALGAYTLAGAWASFEESRKGSLRPGRLADVVVLSQDLFRVDPMTIHQTRVVLTVFAGRVVYQP